MSGFILKEEFSNLYELTDYFRTEEICMEYLSKMVWEEEVTCPFCDCKKVYHFSDGIRHKCSKCRKQFTARSNSVFGRSKVPLRKWFIALYLTSSHKKGISSHQLAKDIGVTQKTALSMLKRIRMIYSKINEDLELEGVVELDETFVGGKNKNRHYDKKVPYSQGRSFKDKTPVFGMLQRGGMVIAKVVPDTKAKTLRPFIDKYISEGSTIYTDEWNYGNIEEKYHHRNVNHGAHIYGMGDIHTNTIEGFWSHLKRGIIGIYHNVSRKYLQLYVDEFSFRYNTREMTEIERMNKLLSLCKIREDNKNPHYG